MVKVISVSDDVYEMLRAMKRGNESFSDVIRRLIKKSSVKEFSGTLSRETAETVISIREELNRKIREGLR